MINPENFKSCADVQCEALAILRRLIPEPGQFVQPNNELYARACALLAAAPEAPATAVVQVPQGWKLVPVEPTERMCKAAADAWLDCHSKMVLNKAGAASKAAIAAAPEAPAQEKSNG